MEMEALMSLYRGDIETALGFKDKAANPFNPSVISFKRDDFERRNSNSFRGRGRGGYHNFNKRYHHLTHSFLQQHINLHEFDIQYIPFCPIWLLETQTNCWFIDVNKEDIPFVFQQILRLGLDFILKPTSNQIKAQFKTFLNIEEEHPSILHEIVHLFTQFLIKNNLKVVPTDKNMGDSLITVVKYNQLAKDILLDETTFTKERKNEQSVVQSYIRTIKELPMSIKKDLFPSERELKLPEFTAYPKVHKNPIKLRPIINAKTVITTRLSIAIHQHLRSYLEQLKESNNFVCTKAEELTDTLKQINKDVQEEIITINSVTMDCLDIKSLYTNLKIESILQAVDYLLQTCRIRPEIWINGNKYNLTGEEVHILIKTYLNFNYLIFDSTVYQQIKGVPTGGNCSPDLAIITLSYYEQQIQKDFRDSIKYSKRYLDDWIVIVINKHYDSETMLKIYQNDLELERAVEMSNDRKIFLDLEIYFNKDTKQFEYSLYRKPGNCYNFIHAKSYIDITVKRGVIIGELTRIRRRCLLNKDFKRNVNALLVHFRNRGYSTEFLNHALITFTEKRRKETTNEIQKPQNYIIFPYYNGITKWEILNAYKKHNPNCEASQIVFRNQPKLANYIRKLLS
jgi:hypothetical protein